MEEEDVVCHLLLTLPESFDSVVTALETMKLEELNLEFAKGRLLDSDTKRKTKSKESNDYPDKADAIAMAISKRDLTCYRCGKKGHYKADCKQNNYRDSTCQNNHHSQSYFIYGNEEEDHVTLEDHVAF